MNISLCSLLDPLQFRQMSGRAGRRGFDTVARVVFFGVPTHKLKSLLTSAVPDLKGGQERDRQPVCPDISEGELVQFHAPGGALARPMKYIGVPTHKLKSLLTSAVPGLKVRQEQVCSSTF
jgi:hypothetical protein